MNNDIAAEITNNLISNISSGRDVTEEEYLIAVRWNPTALKYIKNQTERICIEAVTGDGYMLQYVINQTEKICLAAVLHDGLALRYVKNQTEKICMAAVLHDGLALRYVDAKNQTEKICMAAVKQNKNALRYVKIKLNNYRNPIITQNDIFTNNDDTIVYEDVSKDMAKEENIKLNAKDELFRLLFNKDFGDRKSEECIACELRKNLSCGNGYEYDYTIDNDRCCTLYITKENIIFYCILPNNKCIQDIYSFKPGEYDSIKFMAKQMRIKYKEE